MKIRDPTHPPTHRLYVPYSSSPLPKINTRPTRRPPPAAPAVDPTRSLSDVTLFGFPLGAVLPA